MLYQPEPDPLLAFPGLSRILIVTDAWIPQVNGVVRTLRTVTEEIRAMGKVVEVVGPDRFNTIPMPSYPEIRLAMFPGSSWRKIIEDFAPDALHIATEGPLGMAARKYAKRHKIAFTTAFHTRFAEYLKARTGIPEFLTYAWLRHFHGAGAAVMVATQSLRDELTARGFKNVRPGRAASISKRSIRSRKKTGTCPVPFSPMSAGSRWRKTCAPFWIWNCPARNWWSATARSAKRWRGNIPTRISPAPASAPNSPPPMPARMSSCFLPKPILLAWWCWKRWPPACPLPPTMSPVRKIFSANRPCRSAR